jgi:hypothetical protein
MRFIVKIDGTEVLLTSEQVEALTAVLQDCEKLYDKTVDKGQGTHGYNLSYVHHLKPFNCSESLNVRVMPTEQYEATKLITKLNKEET